MTTNEVTSPGFYWVQYDTYGHTRCELVQVGDGAEYVYYSGISMVDTLQDFDCARDNIRWTGPLEPPK